MIHGVRVTWLALFVGPVFLAHNGPAHAQKAAPPTFAKARAEQGPAETGPSRFGYHDDHDGRRVADVRVKLVERDGLRSLELVVSAVGPGVDPIPGFAGVRGANRHTAEQID